MKYWKYQVLRALEKVPGIRFYHIARFGSNNVLMMPKVATRSIRDAICIYKGVDIENIGGATKKNKIAVESIEYYTFNELKKILRSEVKLIIIERPWEERLMSCWRQKISSQRDKAVFYFWMYYPLIRPDMSYVAFRKAVEIIPDLFREKHFACYQELAELDEGVIRVSIDDVDSLLINLVGRKVCSNVTEK